MRDQDLGDYTLKTALDLYSLNQYNVLWEPERDDKCILAWSKDNLILCAFKGTSSLQNVFTDLQVLSPSPCHDISVHLDLHRLPGP